MIVGKSTTGEGVTARFGLVSGYDSKPRRRLFEVLQAQGLQMNQAVTFLTDGGDTVRDLTEGHSPLASHILDWFHIAMRLTVLNQMAKGVAVEQKGKKFEEELERVKWFLWQNNVYKALQLLDWLKLEIDEEASPEARKLARTLYEFDHYIRVNQSSLPNYDDRYRNGEPISSSIAESSANQIISKRFVKKQQMMWCRRGAHLLLQVRTRVLDDTLTATFQCWYPGMKTNDSQQESAPAAIEFLRGFYDAIGAGIDIERAYREGLEQSASEGMNRNDRSSNVLFSREEYLKPGRMAIRLSTKLSTIFIWRTLITL